jgi:ketohexokinase
MDDHTLKLTNNSYRVVLFGAVYIDTILTSVSSSCPDTFLTSPRTPFYPAEDSKLRASTYTRRRGGNAPNTAEVLSQWPHISPILICPLPVFTCADTGFIRASLHGADLTPCVERPGAHVAASSTIIRSSATGSRTIVSFNEVPEVTAAEFGAKAEGIGQVDWWHFEGRIPDVTVQCIDVVRDLGAVVSCEVEKPGRDGLLEMARKVDVVFYSRGWAVVC